MDTTGQRTGQKLSTGRKLLIGVYAGALILGAPLLIYTCVADQAEVRHAGTAYIEALRQNRVDDAYDMLSSETKNRVPRVAFESSMGTKELRHSTEESWMNSRSSSSGKGCLAGGVLVDDESHHVNLYMLREADRWTVHTLFFDEADQTARPWTCD